MDQRSVVMGVDDLEPGRNAAFIGRGDMNEFLVLDGGVIGPKLVEHGFDFIEPAQLYPMGFHAEHAIISQSRGQNPVIPAIDGGKILFDQGDDFGLFHVNSPAITAYYGTEI